MTEPTKKPSQKPSQKPSYDAARRIRRLMIAVVAAVAVYSAGWFWAAGRVGAAVDDIEAGNGGAIAWSCPGQSVRGFPLRIGVYCDRLEMALSDGRYAVSGGAVRSSAVVHSPRRIVAAFEAPVVVRDRAAGSRYALDWQRARSNLVTAPAAARMAGFEAERATLAMDGLGTIAAADRLGIYLRERGGALDIAVRPRGLSVDPALTLGRRLPAVGLDIDVRLEDWKANWSGTPARGGGIVNRLALLLTDDRGIIVQGPFSLSPEGRISGEFDVRIVDVSGTIETVRAAFPLLAPQLEALAAATSRQEGQPEDELSLSLTVREGRVFAGIVPLGRIPPLPAGGPFGL